MSHRSSRKQGSESNQSLRLLHGIHLVAGDKVHVMAVPHDEGGWRAKVWGADFACLVVLPTRELAGMEACDRFRQAFPEHRCDARCRGFSDDHSSTGATVLTGEFTMYREVDSV